jgi:hypothetical protein
MWESGLFQSSSTTTLQDRSSSGSDCHYLVMSVTDPHHFGDIDADPDPAFHSDIDPDPDPTFQIDADSNPDPITHFFPDLDPPLI